MLMDQALTGTPSATLRQSRMNAMGERLTIPVNGIYFDQIRDGTKLEEYRLCTPFWVRRLHGREYSAVVMTRGYPKGGGIEGRTRLTRRWNGFKRKQVTHPHFGLDPVEVFAIDVSTPKGPISE
jgi:hypothetical protein